MLAAAQHAVLLVMAVPVWACWTCALVSSGLDRLGALEQPEIASVSVECSIKTLHCINMSCKVLMLHSTDALARSFLWPA